MGERLAFGHNFADRIGWTYNNKDEVKDLTETLNNLMLSDLNEGEMQLFVLLVWGLPGTGKSELCSYLAYLCGLHYENDSYVVHTNNLKVIYESFGRHPDKSVKVGVVHDAAQHLSSSDGAMKGTKELYKDWHEIRHLAEDATGQKTGRIIVIMNFQKLSTIHPIFRNNADAFIMLSPAGDKADVKEIKDRIGTAAYDGLRNNRRMTLKGNHHLKCNSIVSITAHGFPDGVGWYHSEYLPKYAPDYKVPKLIKSYAAATVTKEEILEDMLREPQWTAKVEQYIANTRTGEHKERQEDIAFRYGVSQEMVSKNISAVRKEIDRRSDPGYKKSDAG